MPCNCDHLEPDEEEVEISRIMCLLDELEGESIDANRWRGFHPKVYCKLNPLDGASRKKTADDLTALLCLKLGSADLRKYSDEMQEWWDKHKKIDESRIEISRKKYGEMYV